MGFGIAKSVSASEMRPAGAVCVGLARFGGGLEANRGGESAYGNSHKPGLLAHHRHLRVEHRSATSIQVDQIVDFNRLGLDPQRTSGVSAVDSAAPKLKC